MDRFALSGNIGFDVPKDLEGVDEAFLTRVLVEQNLLGPGNVVTGIDSKIIGADKGFTSNVMLAKLTYKEPPAPGTAPEKLVIKIMGGEVEKRSEPTPQPSNLSTYNSSSLCSAIEGKERHR